MKNMIPFPAPSASNVIRYRILEIVEKYVDAEGVPASDEIKRERVAAYLSGMLTASSWSCMRSGKQMLMPAALNMEVIEVAKTLGLHFEKMEDEGTKVKVGSKLIIEP